jgi:hypothetical protein
MPPARGASASAQASSPLVVRLATGDRRLRGLRARDDKIRKAQDPQHTSVELQRVRSRGWILKIFHAGHPSGESAVVLIVLIGCCGTWPVNGEPATLADLQAPAAQRRPGGHERRTIRAAVGGWV